MKKIIITILILAMFALTVKIILSAVDKTNKAKCMQLVEQSFIYDGFFYSDSELEMCEYYGIVSK